MKRIISVPILITLSAFLVMFIMKDEVINVEANQTNEEWAWTVSEFNENNVNITEYLGDGGDVVIPSELDGKTVRNIMYGVFHDRDITSIYIPSSIFSFEVYEELSANTVRYYISNPFRGNLDLVNIEVESGGNFIFENGILYINASNNNMIPQEERGYHTLTNTNVNQDEVVLSENTTSIYAGTFLDNKISRIVLPEGLSVITPNAFLDNHLSEVIIPDSVKSIGQFAFSNNELEYVSIGNNVETIDRQAFSKNKINELILGNSVEYIGGWAFDNVELSNKDEFGITELVLPDSLVEIDNSAFRYHNIETLVIPNSVERIGTYAFYVNELDSLEIGATTIDNYAFSHNKINELILNDGVEYIGDYAFQNTVENKITYGVSELILPDSLIEIGDSAFRYHNIETLVVPNDVERIGTYAFYVNELDSLEIGATTIDNYAFSHNKINELVLNNGVEYIGKWAFDNVLESNKNLHGITQLILPDSLIEIDDRAFRYHNIETLVVPNDVERIGISTFYANELDSLEVGATTIDNYAFSHNKINELILNDGVEYIGDYAFQITVGNKGVYGISELVLPDSLIEIGGRAFIRNNIESIVIPDSVVTLGPSAFYENELNHVEIGNGVKRIESFTFSHNKINTLILGNSVEYLGGDSFQNLNENKGLYGISELILPDSLIEIDERAFFLHDIEELIVPDNVIKIGVNAFRLNEISNLKIGDGVKRIEQSAFYQNKLDNLTLGESLEYIGGWAFYSSAEIKNNHGLTELIIPNGVTEIGNSAFTYHNIKNIIIPDNVTRLGTHAFSYNELENVKLGKGLKVVDNYSFYNNSLRRIDIPSTVESLGNSAFDRNSLEIAIVRGDNTTIGASMLAGNPGFNGVVDVVAHNPSQAKTYADRFTNYRYIDINSSGSISPESNKEFQKGPFDVTLRSTLDRDELTRYAIINGPYRTPLSNEWVEENVLSSIHETDGLSISLESGEWTVVLAGKSYLDGSDIEVYKTYKVDSIAPTATIVQNTDNPTHDNIILTVNAQDDFSGIKEILFDGDNIVEDPNVEIEENGIYEFTIIDNAGNSTTVTHEVTNIERIISLTKPTIDNFGQVELSEENASTNVSPIFVSDWRESNDEWVINVSATKLKRGSQELNGGFLSLKGLAEVLTVDGNNGTFTFDSDTKVIDDGPIELVHATESNGEYELIFPSGALEVSIDSSTMKKGTYETTITWEIVSAP